MPAFCPCLETLLAAKLKGFRLMALSEKISRQPSIDYIMWSLTGEQRSKYRFTLYIPLEDGANAILDYTTND